MEYAIPSWLTDNLITRLDKINARAEKLGAPKIEVKLGERFIGRNKELYRKVEIIGETPTIKGWTVDAAVEYIGEGKEVVKAVNKDFVCPTHYRGAKPFCEHCNTHKVKRYSMILRNVETGEYKMVGKTCLVDFLGEDIEGIVYRFNNVCEILEDFDADGSGKEGAGMGGAAREFSVDTILEYAAYSTLLEGYKSASYDDSTKNSVMVILTTPKLLAKIKPDAAAKKYAAEVKKWVMENESTNDFMINVKNLMNTGYVAFNMIGYIVGAVGGYVAHVAREEKKRAEAATVLNEHFGEVKKRYTLDLTLIKMTDFEGYYGTTWIHTFRDNDGRVFVWFGSKRLRDNAGERVDVGTTIKVKATVKDHGEYRGVAQTNITRVAPAK